MKEQLEKSIEELKDGLEEVRRMMNELESGRTTPKSNVIRTHRRTVSGRWAFGLIFLTAFLVLDGNLQSQQQSDDALFIDSSGRVGIGTEQPQTKLEVARNQAIKVGNAYLSSGGDYVHLANNGWYDGQKWQATAPGALIQFSGQNTAFYTHDEEGNHTNRLIVNSAGNVGIGTANPKSKLEVAGAIRANSLNGEKPPMIFEIGSKGDTKKWNAVNQDIGPLCGDADGCTMKFLFRVNSTDEVRVITEHIYIEQPDKSSNKSPGLQGWTRQLAGGEIRFVLQTAKKNDIVPHPWDWIYVRNYSSREVGPESNAFGGYQVQFMTRPNVSATVIIYDR